MSTPIRVVIADDHHLTRVVVHALLELSSDIKVVAEATNGDEALECCRDHSPDILLLDLSMPGPPTNSIVSALRNNQPQVRVVILTAFDYPQMIPLLEREGICGYVMKDEAVEELVPVVQTVAMGGRRYSRSLLQKYHYLEKKQRYSKGGA